MDPEYLRRDARAVEDPIGAIFDLAESVDRQSPKIRKMLRYVRIFVSLWLVLDVLFMVVISQVFNGAPALTLLLFLPIVACFLVIRYASQSSTRLALLITASVFGGLQVLSFGPAFFFGALLVVLFFLGFLILELLRDLRSFFDYFALRHRVIQRVREADPVVYVPQGKDAVQRILTYIASRSPEARAVMALPGALAAPVLLSGRSGLTYSFDAYLRAQPSALAKLTGLGSPGFAVFVKAFEHAPSIDELKALKAAVEDVSAATRIPPARVVALWHGKPEGQVSPEAYGFLTRDAIQTTIRGSVYACSVELAREDADGTYDFIPVVVDTPRGGTAAGGPAPPTRA